MNPMDDAAAVLASINHEIDGSGLCRPCASCGQRVPFDCIVDDDFWVRAVYRDHREWGPDVLCLPCLARLGGPETHDNIRLIYFSAEGRTSVFVPEAILVSSQAETEKLRERVSEAERLGLLDPLQAIFTDGVAARDTETYGPGPSPILAPKDDTEGRK
jgi:hypothetical protein